MKQLLDHITHLFAPRRSNNFRAKLLHHDMLTVYLIAALTFTITIHFHQARGNILGYATDITVNKLYELTNAERTKLDLSPLSYNEDLAEAAEKKAQDMFEKDYWSHYGPAGETPWNFILGAGYQYEFAGENLAKNFLFSDGVVEAWMNSPTHRENIVRGEYSDVGFAVMNGMLNGEETTLVVQMFGKPLYKTINAEEPQAPTQPITDAQQATEIVPEQSTLASSDFYSSFFNINMLFIALMIVAVSLDFYFAVKLGLIRISGNNISHLIFLISIFIGSFILIKGSII